MHLAPFSLTQRHVYVTSFNSKKDSFHYKNVTDWRVRNVYQKHFRSSLSAALLCTAMPVAGHAAVMNYEWTVAYTEPNSTQHTVRLMFAVDDSAPDKNPDPAAGFFDMDSVVGTWLSGPMTGQVSASGMGEVATFAGETRVRFDNLKDSGGNDLLLFMRLFFHGNGDFVSVPVFDTADYLHGEGYATSFGQGSVTINSVADTAPQIPVPASGALLAMAVGGMALRSAAKAKRAKARATAA